MVFGATVCRPSHVVCVSARTRETLYPLQGAVTAPLARWDFTEHRKHLRNLSTFVFLPQTVVVHAFSEPLIYSRCYFEQDVNKSFSVAYRKVHNGGEWNQTSASKSNSQKVIPSNDYGCTAWRLRCCSTKVLRSFLVLKLNPFNSYLTLFYYQHEYKHLSMYSLMYFPALMQTRVSTCLHLWTSTVKPKSSWTKPK